MQAIRPNSGLNYQSLDLPLHITESYLPDRKFKYNHIIRMNNKQLNLKIGDYIKLSNIFWEMSKIGVKRDGFFPGILMKFWELNQIFPFPLYKTVEEYNFYKN
jgi:hypothetical protein